MNTRALITILVLMSCSASANAAAAVQLNSPVGLVSSTGLANFDLAKLDLVLPGRHTAAKVPKLPDNLFAMGAGQIPNRNRDVQTEFAAQLSGLKATAVYWAPVTGMTRKRYEEVKDEKGKVVLNPDGSVKRVLRERIIPPEEQPTHMVVIGGYVLRVGNNLPRALVKGEGRVQIVEISQNHVRLAGEMQSTGFDGRPTKVPAFTNIPVDAHEVLPED